MEFGRKEQEEISQHIFSNSLVVLATFNGNIYNSNNNYDNNSADNVDMKIMDLFFSKSELKSLKLTILLLAKNIQELFWSSVENVNEIIISMHVINIKNNLMMYVNCLFIYKLCKKGNSKHTLCIKCLVYDSKALFESKHLCSSDWQQVLKNT